MRMPAWLRRDPEPVADDDNWPPPQDPYVNPDPPYDEGGEWPPDPQPETNREETPVSVSASAKAPTVTHRCPTCRQIIPSDGQMLAESLEIIRPHVGTIIAEFYRRLFERWPHYRPWFPEDMSVQHERLVGAIVAVVNRYDDKDWLRQALTTMGRQHTRFDPDKGCLDYDDYAAVSGTLLETVGDFASDNNVAFAPYVPAWRRALTYISGIMMAAGAVANEVPAGRRHGTVVDDDPDAR